MSNDTPTQAPLQAAGLKQPVAVKLPARSAAISVHSSNHATTMVSSAFAWR